MVNHLRATQRHLPPYLTLPGRHPLRKHPALRPLDGPIPIKALEFSLSYLPHVITWCYLPETGERALP